MYYSFLSLKTDIFLFGLSSQQGRRGYHCSPSFAVSPKVSQKNEARKLANEDKDPVNKSGGEAKKKKGIPRQFSGQALQPSSAGQSYERQTVP